MQILSTGKLMIAVTLFALTLGAPSAFSQGFVEVAKLMASDGTLGDHFGRSIAISGDTVIVGAFNAHNLGGTSGAAYVFTGTGDGWAEQAKLTASGAGVGSNFGWSVAISGDTAVIGDSYGEAAYVFVRNGMTWTEQARLTASDAGTSDAFGWAVAVSGDTAVIGARQDDDGGHLSGSAYVFTRSGTIWTEQAKLTASDATAKIKFGDSVAISGNTAVIGAIGHVDFDEGDRGGAAYVFTRSGTTWTEQAKLIGSPSFPGDLFADSVSLSGDTAVIGAIEEFEFPYGPAYVFRRTGTTWTEQAKLMASDQFVGDQFAFSVAVGGDTVLVGAYQDDDGGFESGSAYVFRRTGTTWTEQDKLTASDAASGDLFGYSVATSGDTAVVGAYPDRQAGDRRGSAYVFTMADGLQVEIDIKPFGKPGKPNRVRVGARHFIKVAVLSTNTADGDAIDFDALQVDPSTVVFGPNRAPAKRNWLKVRDVDNDGDLDVILRFRIKRTRISCDDTRATLEGETYSGVPFAASDPIKPVPCNR